MIRNILVAAAFAIALTPAGLAQETTAPKFSSSTSTVGQLLDNPEAKAVFVKVLPELANHPDIEQGREMTLKAIADMGYADATKFKELDEELAKIK